VERTVEIAVDAPTVDRSFDKQLNQLIRSVKIPGFRPGKAPRKLVRSRVDQEHLNRTVFEDVGVPAYEQALRQEKLDPVSQPNLELVQLEEGKDLIFRATFEVRPQVSLDASEYEGLEVEVDHTEVQDEDVDRHLEELRKKHERTIVVEEKRPLERGDLAVVDFSSKIDGEPVPNGSSENFQIDVDDRLFVEGFADKLIGMELDEKRNFDFPFPEEYGNKTLAGKTVNFDFHLKSIKKRELPELDDDLAREASRHQTLEELKASFRERLEGNVRNDVGNRALEKLASTKELVIPNAFVNQMITWMLENQARQLAQIGIRFEDFLKSRNTTIERLFQDMRPQATQMAKAELLLEALVRDNGIEVSDEELDAEIQRLADQSGQEFDVVKGHFQEARDQDAFRKDVLRRKAVQFLADKVKAVKRPEPTEEAGSEAESEASTETEGTTEASEAKPAKKPARKAKADDGEASADAPEAPAKKKSSKRAKGEAETVES